jgi:hypothetical protein
MTAWFSRRRKEALQPFVGGSVAGSAGGNDVPACACPCHRGLLLLHPVACCQPCPRCRRRVPTGALAAHWAHAHPGAAPPA